MTAKARQPINTVRPPIFVCRATGARELEISEDTWDDWVRRGILPAAAVNNGQIVRWHWASVEAALAPPVRDAIGFDPLMAGVAKHVERIRKRAAS